jgi:hypothetical protein
MAAMAEAMPQGRHLHCLGGNHMAIDDDQAVDIAGLISLLHDGDAE